MNLYCKKHKGQVPKECPRCLELECKRLQRNLNDLVEKCHTLNNTCKQFEMLYTDRRQEVLFLRQQTEELITSMGTQFKRIADAIAVKYNSAEKKEKP